MIFIVVISTTYLILRDVLLLMPWSWQRLQVNHLGELNLFNNHRQSFAPKLKATTFIHPLLIILDVKESKLRTGFFSGIPMVLITSQMDKEQHRQLRVWLRWWKHEGL